MSHPTCSTRNRAEISHQKGDIFTAIVFCRRKQDWTAIGVDRNNMRGYSGLQHFQSLRRSGHQQFEQWGIQAGCWQSDAPSCCYCCSITWQIEMLIWILILSSSSPDVAATGLGFPAMQKIASTRLIGGPFSECRLLFGGA
jgi:hypothetical protein